MEFKIKSFTIHMDEEDALQFVGVGITLSSHGYARINNTYLHRIITGAKDGEVVDHINGNKLDNRKQNLRICSQAENCLNSIGHGRSKSGIKGVWYDSRREKWTAQISVKYKTISLGRFNDKDEAILARHIAEQKYHGDFAASKGVLNEEIKVESRERTLCKTP